MKIRYLKVKDLKDFVKTQGKRMSPNFALWVSMKVESIVLEQCRALGKTKTLNMEDAEALERMKTTVKDLKRKRTL